MSHESDLRSKLWRKWYVMRMSFTKSRIKPETKMRQLVEFEDAVVDYAQAIIARRNSG